MFLLAHLSVLVGATLLVGGPSDGLLDNETVLQMSPASTQLSEGTLRRGSPECETQDSQGGTCWLHDLQMRNDNFRRYCGRKGQMYNFWLGEYRCYCFKCQ